MHINPKILPTRNSCDQVSNRQGKEFIEMCNDFNLRILNGAFQGDEMGFFTYSSSLGDSVNDIAAISNSVINKVQHFAVENANWSDHFPISIVLQNKILTSDSTKKSIVKLNWSANNSIKYCNNLDKQLKGLQDGDLALENYVKL